MSFEGWIIITGMLVGIVCGTIGCFLILRKMAMLADAISHTVLLGIVVAFLVSNSLDGIYMLIGSASVGLLTAWFVQLLHQSGVQSDAAIGVVFTSLFALGVVLVTVYADKVHLDVNHALMGDITFVPWNTLELFGYSLGPKAVWMLGTVALINFILIWIFYKELKITSFDPQMALALGIPVTFIHYLLMGMLSLSTVASFDSVGAILVVAMLIAPGATAYLLTDRLIVMIILSAAVGAVAAIVGYYSASYWNISIAGAMAASCGLLFLLAFLFSPKHGLLFKRLSQQKLKQSEAFLGK